MKKLLIILTVLFVGTANASIIYTVNRVVGAGSVVGTVTTDGALGTLATANFTDWDLTINDGSSAFNLLGPASVGSNSALLVSGTSLVATATDILFDFAASGFALFQNPNIGSGTNWWCVEAVNSGCAGTGSSTESITVGTTIFVQNAGQVSIASTARQPISEPLTLALMGMGLLGLRLSSKRK